jgi:hypothetical protein
LLKVIIAFIIGRMDDVINVLSGHRIIGTVEEEVRVDLNGASGRRKGKWYVTIFGWSNILHKQERREKHTVVVD